jgi:hypothetical protein
MAVTVSEEHSASSFSADGQTTTHYNKAREHYTPLTVKTSILQLRKVSVNSHSAGKSA